MKLRTEPFEVSLGPTKYTVRMTLGVYEDGTPAISLIDVEDDSPFAKLTVSVPDVKLGPDEVLVKTWSENGLLARALLDLGYFVPTGRSVKTGFCIAEVWRVV